MKFSPFFMLLLLLGRDVHAQLNYNDNGDGTTSLVSYSGPGGVVVIPDSYNGSPITSIYIRAFLGTKVTSVTIGANVTDIGILAFETCLDLTNITFDSSLTNIGYSAFQSCSALPSVIIPNSVTIIGNQAFLGCTGLTNLTIGTNVTSIGGNTFGVCTNLTSVTIPANVTNITTDAFYHCPALTNVFFQGNSPIPTNDLSVFSGDNNGTVYYLPGTTGWGSMFDGLPTALWLPQAQTSDGSFGVQTNQFGFNINWASGQTVVVEACTNLANPDWIPVATNNLTSGSSYFSEPQWTNYPVRYYRLRSP